MYYFLLLRCHIRNQLHLKNRKNLDTSWKRLTDDRRRLRIITNKDTYLEKIKALKNFNKSI